MAPVIPKATGAGLALGPGLRAGLNLGWAWSLLPSPLVLLSSGRGFISPAAGETGGQSQAPVVLRARIPEQDAAPHHEGHPRPSLVPRPRLCHRGPARQRSDEQVQPRDSQQDPGGRESRAGGRPGCPHGPGRIGQQSPEQRRRKNQAPLQGGPAASPPRGAGRGPLSAARGPHVYRPEGSLCENLGRFSSAFQLWFFCVQTDSCQLFWAEGPT